MQEEYVECQLCGEKFKNISHNHLKWKHDMTVVEYREQFPDASMNSDSYRKSLSDGLKVSLADESTIRGAKSKVIRDWIAENQGKHFCHCGCDQSIEIRDFHYTYGIPKYIDHHYSQTDECKSHNELVTSQRYIDDPTLADRQSTSLKQYYIDNPEAKELLVRNGAENGMYGVHRYGSDAANWQGGKIGCICGWCGDIFDDWRGGDSQFCSYECMGKWISVFRTGEDAPNWRGGISDRYGHFTPSPEWRKWREDVFERDDYTCQMCGERGGYLHAHHIYPRRHYPEPQFSLNLLNGITLCRDCHYSISGKEYDYLSTFLDATMGINTQHEVLILGTQTNEYR